MIVKHAYLLFKNCVFLFLTLYLLSVPIPTANSSLLLFFVLIASGTCVSEQSRDPDCCTFTVTLSAKLVYSANLARELHLLSMWVKMANVKERIILGLL